VTGTSSKHLISPSKLRGRTSPSKRITIAKITGGMGYTLVMGSTSVGNLFDCSASQHALTQSFVANTTHDDGPKSRIGSFNTPRHPVHGEPRSRWGDAMAGNTRRRLVNRPLAPPAAQPKSAIALMRSAMRSTSSLIFVESAGELGSHWARPAVMTNQSHLQNRRHDDTEHGSRLVSTSSTRSRKSAGSRSSLETTKTTPSGSQSRAFPVGTEWPHVRGSAATHASAVTSDNKKDRTLRPGMLKSAWSSVSKLVSRELILFPGA